MNFQDHDFLTCLRKFRVYHLKLIQPARNIVIESCLKATANKLISSNPNPFPTLRQFNEFTRKEEEHQCEQFSLRLKKIKKNELTKAIGKFPVKQQGLNITVRLFFSCLILSSNKFSKMPSGIENNYRMEWRV